MCFLPHESWKWVERISAATAGGAAAGEEAEAERPREALRTDAADTALRSSFLAQWEDLSKRWRKDLTGKLLTLPLPKPAKAAKKAAPRAADRAAAAAAEESD